MNVIVAILPRSFTSCLCVVEEPQRVSLQYTWQNSGYGFIIPIGITPNPNEKHEAPFFHFKVPIYSTNYKGVGGNGSHLRCRLVFMYLFQVMTLYLWLCIGG